MEQLNWELSVVTRAVAFPNLTTAAGHVGLSQPQLSRIVSKLETELGVMLLDRAVKRKSGWTPAALRLAQIYSGTVRYFQGEVQKLVSTTQPTHVRLGTLEGLTGIAMSFARHLFERTGVHTIELLVEDLDTLEELFGSRALDLIFTQREPGRKKYRYALRLGHQTIEVSARKGDVPQGFRVMSSFEYGTRARAAKGGEPPTLVSNSLDVRKRWIAAHGGTGTLPSEIRKGKPSRPNEVPALLLGADDLPHAFWEKASAFPI